MPISNGTLITDLFMQPSTTHQVVNITSIIVAVIKPYSCKTCLMTSTMDCSLLFEIPNFLNRALLFGLSSRTLEIRLL